MAELAVGETKSSKEDYAARIRHLEQQLEIERSNCRQLEQDKRVLKQACVSLQQHAEQDEEFISNSLMRRIKVLEKEKTRLESIGEDTQALHYQLEHLRKEKVTYHLFVCALTIGTGRFGKQTRARIRVRRQQNDKGEGCSFFCNDCCSKPNITRKNFLKKTTYWKKCCSNDHPLQ